MEREYFISLLNRGLTSKPTTYDITSVLTEYCNRVNKEEKYKELIQVCIQMLIEQVVWQPYYEQAIKYLMSEYNVGILYDKEKMVKTPFGDKSERQIIMFV